MDQLRPKSTPEIGKAAAKIEHTVHASAAERRPEWKPMNFDTAVSLPDRQFGFILPGHDDDFVTTALERRNELARQHFDAAEIGPEELLPE
jgi:hypothetical protein